MGIPMTIDILQRQVLIHVLNKQNDVQYNSFKRYILMQVFVFLNRSLEYSNFIRRKSSISQKCQQIGGKLMVCT